MLIDRLLPSVEEILDSKLAQHPATISEIYEQLDTVDYWEHLQFYVVRNLIQYVYGDTTITDSKIEILFEEDD